MATIDSLRRRVAAMRAEIDKRRPGREWSMILEEGEEVSEKLRSQLGEYDTLYIRRFPKGYLSNGGECEHSQVMSCWLPGPKGHQRPHVVRQYGCDISKV